MCKLRPPAPFSRPAVDPTTEFTGMSIRIPGEHGTWFMVFSPLTIGLASGPAPDLVSTALLVVSVLAAFLAQDAGRGLLRRRRDASLGWFAILAAIGVAASVPLVIRVPDLVIVAGVAAVLGLPQLVLLSRSSRRRYDRTRFGQLLGVPLFSLTAVAGHVVVHGELLAIAWWLWIFCIAYFTGGVFLVHMLFAAARQKREIDWQQRWQIGSAHVVYHVGLAAFLVVSRIAIGGTPGLFLGIAFLPAVARAFVHWYRLDKTLPKLSRVGLLEALYATWFTAFMIAAFQV